MRLHCNSFCKHVDTIAIRSTALAIWLGAAAMFLLLVGQSTRGNASFAEPVSPDISTQTLQEDAPEMQEALRQQVENLQGDDLARRRESAEQMSQLATEAAPAAVALVRAAADIDEVVQEYVIAALEELGPPLPEAEIELATLLTEEETNIAYWGATLLGRLGNQAENSATALATTLQNHPALSVRQRAAWALGKIGPAASEAANNALTKATQDSDPRLARLAEKALEAIQP